MWMGRRFWRGGWMCRKWTRRESKHLFMGLWGSRGGGGGGLFQGLTMARVAADATLERFKALGGEQVYVLVSFPDAWPALDPLAVLIPIGAGGDIHGMEAMVKGRQLGKVMGKEVVVEELGDQMLYVGSSVALKRLKSLHASARPELTE